MFLKARWVGRETIQPQRWGKKSLSSGLRLATGEDPRVVLRNSHGLDNATLFSCVRGYQADETPWSNACKSRGGECKAYDRPNIVLLDTTHAVYDYVLKTVWPACLPDVTKMEKRGDIMEAVLGFCGNTSQPHRPLCVYDKLDPRGLAMRKLWVNPNNLYMTTGQPHRSAGFS